MLFTLILTSSYLLSVQDIRVYNGYLGVWHMVALALRRKQRAHFRPAVSAWLGYNRESYHSMRSLSGTHILRLYQWLMVWGRSVFPGRSVDREHWLSL